ncbi:MAG: ArsA family ATPase [Myxococcota bacterium]
MKTPFPDKRFVIIAGKGGVGKSTMCAALGLAAARAGLRTIVAELNTREKVPTFFGKKAHGYEPVELRKNLFSLNIQPEPALHEYALRKVRFERVYRTVFENDAVKRLLKMIPGMNELLLLGKAFDLEREEDDQGKRAWDLVIVDAPATGHGLSLLRLPQAILEVIQTGPMADEVRSMRRLLTDPKRTMINVVTLPEEMPVRETLELLQQVDEVLEIPKGYLLVNGVWPTLVDDYDREILTTFREEAQGRDEIVDGALACLGALMRRRSFQEEYLAELRREITDIPHIEIPFLFVREFGADAIRTLSDHVVREMEKASARRDR